MVDDIIDAGLVGIWLLPGGAQTYEITQTGDYFVADPDAPVWFEEDDAVMVWGAHRYLRREGHGETPVGTWFEEATGDAWDFTEDQGVTILLVDADPASAVTGIWGLRAGCTRLWSCENRAHLRTDGAHITFDTLDGGTLRYGYTVSDDVAVILDPQTWTEVARYVRAELYVEASAAG